MRKDFFNNLKAKRTTYRDMIEFCCDSLVLNNEIMPELINKGFYFETENGIDYDEENDVWADVYQNYIISGSDAERLEEYTNEIVYYCYELNLYILGVTHYGTSWDGVPANWKDELVETW